MIQMIQFIMMKKTYGAISDVKINAVKLALEYRCNVRYDVNGNEHEVVYSKLIEAIDAAT
jgi:hypothetical protein